MMTRDSLADIGIGGTALTVPLWVHQLTEWAQVIVILGSAALVLARLLRLIARAISDFKENKSC